MFIDCIVWLILCTHALSHTFSNHTYTYTLILYYILYYAILYIHHTQVFAAEGLDIILRPYQIICTGISRTLLINNYYYPCLYVFDT